MKKNELDLNEVMLQNLAIRQAIRQWLINVSHLNADNTYSVESKTCEELVQDDVKIDVLSMNIQEIIYSG